MGTYQENYTSNFMVDEPEKIREKTQKLVKILTESLTEADFTEIAHLLQETKSMSYSIQGYLERLQLAKREKDMLMHAGYNSALLDMMRLYTANLYMQEEIKKVTTKYRDMILRILDKRGTLLHKDLAAELMIAPNNLTAIIKQMNATSVKLIHVEEFSKFKSYSLTPIARQYIKKRMPDTPFDRNPKQRDVGYVVGRKTINVSSDGRFDELDTHNEILSLTKDKYKGEIFVLSGKKPPTQRTSLHKFVFNANEYGIRRA